MVDIFLEIAGFPLGALADTSLWMGCQLHEEALSHSPMCADQLVGDGQVKGAVMPGRLLP